MKTIRYLIPVAVVLLLMKAPSTEATLYLSSDPSFGPNSLTVDTSTGLEWLNLTKSVGFSYDQVLADMEPGGMFSGYRYATIQEVMGLYSSAGIPGPGYYSLSSPSVQNLFSLVGSTWSQFGRPALEGFSGTANASLQEAPQIYASGVNSSLEYLVSGPNFLLLSVNPGGSSGSMGSWLVKEVPEPSALALFVAGGFILVGGGRGGRKCRMQSAECRVPGQETPKTKLQTSNSKHQIHWLMSKNRVAP